MKGKRISIGKATWQKTDDYCMNCGDEAVWVRTDEDTYVVPGFVTTCTSCGAQWDYPNLRVFDVMEELL